MSRYCFNTENNKKLKKVISKFVTIELNTDAIQGKVTVIGYRKYSFREEVDIQFEGKILARTGSFNKEWRCSDVLTKKNISKIKVNRFIKKQIHKSLNMRLRYFSIDLRWYSDIKKVKWI
jgi:hypothetical protein